MKQDIESKLIYFLFIIYIILLTWIILFKMQFSLSSLPSIRSINLIPFAGTGLKSEALNNFLVFIPVGIYINILFKNKGILKKIGFICLLSLIYEIIQFILGIGVTDITDILMNTSGGIIGILFIFLIYKLFKNETKIDKVLSLLALITTTLLVLFIAILIVANL